MATDSHTFAVAVSRICGWLYFLAWSLSFYPQPLLNYRRRGTEGLTIDFPLMNVFGFSCYTISTAAFLYSPQIRSEYASRHPASPEPTVRPNDLAFGLHATILSIITISQFWPSLWSWKASASKARPTNVTHGILWGSLLGIAINLVIVLHQREAASPDHIAWGWIDVMYTLTYVKLLFTIFKYLPQSIANYRRKSTAGWAIGQVLLDFFGGILSLVQLLIDSSLQADWSGLTGNPVKFGLANISLVFDIVFLIQHYVLYGPSKHNTEMTSTPGETVATERDALLG